MKNNIIKTAQKNYVSYYWSKHDDIVNKSINNFILHLLVFLFLHCFIIINFIKILNQEKD